MSVTTPRHYTTEELLRDGGSTGIRAIRPDDTQRLLELFARLSSRSMYFRFFQTKQRLTDEVLRAFAELAFVCNVALMATLRIEGYRGAPPGDRQALEDLLRYVLALVDSVPELRECDLNLVKMLRPGEGVMALDGCMSLTPG